jgi:hypothetical protein
MMPKTMIEIRGFAIDPSDDVVFTVTIDAPHRSGPNGDYACKIRSDDSIAFRIDAYGTTPRAAIKTALDMAAARIASFYSSSDAIDQL